MFTKDPSDKHYGERRPLSPGVHVEKSGYEKAKAGSTTGSNDPRTFGVNPINFEDYRLENQANRVMASPYGDTTVVTPGEGMVVTRAQQRVIPQRGVNTNIGATDSRVEVERPNPFGTDLGGPYGRPYRGARGMNTGLKLGSGPRRNEPPKY